VVRLRAPELVKVSRKRNKLWQAKCFYSLGGKLFAGGEFRALSCFSIVSSTRIITGNEAPSIRFSDVSGHAAAVCLVFVLFSRWQLSCQKIDSWKSIAQQL
jgi:hypothetical protein